MSSYFTIYQSCNKSGQVDFQVIQMPSQSGRGWVAWLGSNTENFCNVHKMSNGMRLAISTLGEVYVQSNVIYMFLKF